MDDRQSVAFDKLMKVQKKKKATLLTIVLVAAVLVFLLGLLFGIAISSNALAVSAGAEDLVRDDPLLALEEHSVLRSASSPEYSLTSGGLSAFASWLSSEGYISSSSAFTSSDPLYGVVFADPSTNRTFYSCYVSNGAVVALIPGGGTFAIDPSIRTLAFDSPSFYHFLRYDVGLGFSDFVVVGFDKPIAIAEDTVSSIFTVGDKLLSFVVNNVLVLIPFVLFLCVFAFGSIKRLITGV